MDLKTSEMLPLYQLKPGYWIKRQISFCILKTLKSKIMLSKNKQLDFH